MGDFRAQSVCKLWPLVVALVCLFLAVPGHAADAHEGNLRARDDADFEYETGLPDSSSEEVSRDSGAVIGNLPASQKKPDYDLRKLKPEEYPLEFLIPFMKTSQVFRKKVLAKKAPSLTSRMDIAKDTEAKPKSIPRKWTALPPEPEHAARTIASVVNEAAESSSSTEVGAEALPPAPKPGLVSARPPLKPARQLLESFKASR